MKLKHCIILTFVLLISCSPVHPPEINPVKGSLFIIGGGKRTPELMKSLCDIAIKDTDDYIVVLPMASENQDTAAYYSELSFRNIGYENIISLQIHQNKDITKSQQDSIQNAALVYISGGDQAKFMNEIECTSIHNCIINAYCKGAVIAGTSAGAAMMSEKMISGNQLLLEEYSPYFPDIKANNIEITKGLGLIDGVIIDQHFIIRQRLNRLVTAIIENPLLAGIGIDESTAIHVIDNKATVYGEAQVIVILHPGKETRTANGYLGAENMNLSIYLPGEQFEIKQ